tara:strand:- start:4935 stop:5276 length:342 start_codon:yes stop_codon:yes gene_type:complete
MNINIDLDDSVLSHLSVQANTHDTTLSAYITQILNGFIAASADETNTVAEQGTAPVAVNAIKDVENVKVIEKTEVPVRQGNTSASSLGTEEKPVKSKGAPLYCKRDVNSWSID